jgi:ParB-like chromosome segregation protein Spo0J
MHPIDAQVAPLQPHDLSDEIFGQLPEDRLEDLKKDIEERGLQYPLVVDRFNRVICGSQRLRAIKTLGWTTVEVLQRTDLETEEDIREYLIKDNLYRRHLTPRQEFNAARELERLYEARKQHGDGRTNDKVAKDMGTNRQRIRRLKQVFTSNHQDLIDQVDKGQLSLHAAAEEVSARRKISPAVLPDDDRRATVLKAIRFRREVDKFQALLSRHTFDAFGSYQDQVQQQLKSLQYAIDDFLR